MLRKKKKCLFIKCTRENIGQRPKAKAAGSVCEKTQKLWCETFGVKYKNNRRILTVFFFLEIVFNNFRNTLTAAITTTVFYFSRTSKYNNYNLSLQKLFRQHNIIYVIKSLCLYTYKTIHDIQ